jgi:hypothetical protein
MSRYHGIRQVYSSYATRQIFIVICFWIHHSTSLYCQILPLTQDLLRIYSNKCATHVDCYSDVSNSIQVAIIQLRKENCYHGTLRFVNFVVKHCTWTIF